MLDEELNKKIEKIKEGVELIDTRPDSRARGIIFTVVWVLAVVAVPILGVDHYWLLWVVGAGIFMRVWYEDMEARKAKSEQAENKRRQEKISTEITELKEEYYRGMQQEKDELRDDINEMAKEHYQVSQIRNQRKATIAETNKYQLDEKWDSHYYNLTMLHTADDGRVRELEGVFEVKVDTKQVTSLMTAIHLQEDRYGDNGAMIHKGYYNGVVTVSNLGDIQWFTN